MVENEFKYDIGELFLPISLLERRVKAMYSYFKKEYKKADTAKEHVNKLYNMLCFVYYMSYMRKGEVLSSGELKIATPIFRQIYGQSFKDDFTALVALDKQNGWGNFSLRQGLPNTRRINAFGVHLKDRRTKCTRIDKDSCLYTFIRDSVAYFMEYIKEHTEETVPDAYKQFSDNYRKYEIDMQIASDVCLERNGVSFSDIKSYMKSHDEVRMSDHEFIVHQQAANEMHMCKAFNNSSYIVKEVYGRLYTPFHNLPKAYRSAFKLRVNGESVVELADMSGAFVRGGLQLASCVAYELNNDFVSSKIRNRLQDTVDPYAFAVSDEYSRADIKPAVLSFLFARPAHIKRRDALYNKIQRNADVNEVFNYCTEFLSFVDANPSLMFMSASALNKALRKFAYTNIIANILGFRVSKRMFWSTASNKKASNNITSFIMALRRIKDAILHNHVTSSIKSVYGEDVYDALILTSEIFTEATMHNVLEEQTKMREYCTSVKVKPYNKIDLYKGNTINSSIVCQMAEGDMMFRSVLPTIQKNTGCTKLISLHDGIFCPSSVKDSVDVCEVDKEMRKWFDFYVMNVYVNNPMVRDAMKMYKYKNVKEIAA